jgi:hypothetical protein
MNDPSDKQVEYRGFVLEIIQEPKTHLWILRYRLSGYSPVISKLRWKTSQEAEAHGKRMIDAIVDTPL